MPFYHPNRETSPTSLNPSNIYPESKSYPLINFTPKALPCHTVVVAAPEAMVPTPTSTSTSTSLLAPAALTVARDIQNATSTKCKPQPWRTPTPTNANVVFVEKNSYSNNFVYKNNKTILFSLASRVDEMDEHAGRDQRLLDRHSGCHRDNNTRSGDWRMVMAGLVEISRLGLEMLDSRDRWRRGGCRSGEWVLGVGCRVEEARVFLSLRPSLSGGWVLGVGCLVEQALDSLSLGSDLMEMFVSRVTVLVVVAGEGDSTLANTVSGAREETRKD